MSHWYSRDGSPCHTQLTKKGAKNPTRPTTITDVISQRLLPSVSGITDIVAKPYLDVYKLRGVASACFHAPAISNEDQDSYVNAMLREGQKEGKEAADVGTKIHAALEDLFKPNGEFEDTDITLGGGQVVRMADMIYPAAAKIKELGLEITASEKVLVNRFVGYAGTTDIIFKTADSYGVLDFKSRKTKPGEPVEPYDTQPAQIAAYIAAHWQTDRDVSPFGSKVRGINLYISTTEPGRIDVSEYGFDRLVKEYEAFKNMHALWVWSNRGYNPAF